MEDMEPPPNVDSELTDNLKPKFDDIGWEYAVLVKADSHNKVKCKLCGKEVHGGINRLKYHIANIRGNVKPCPRATPLDKERCQRALDELKKTKKGKKEHIQEVRDDVDINGDDVVEIQGSTSIKKSRTLGPMDQFSRPIDPTELTAELRKKSRQQNLSDSLFKHRTNDVHSYLARWVYEAGIPFNAINHDGFQRFCEAAGQFGPGYIPASQYQLRKPLLKQEVGRTKNLMKEQEEEWKANGCSLMTDAWSDRNRRNIMNLCVNYKAGTSFISSIESSDEAHTGKFIFEYVDKYIGEIGCDNVIQVVTDNASNNMAAAKLLKAKRPNIFWTSYATHTFNLILEGIGKIPRIQHIIEKAKALTIFIYAHHTTLALMRKFTRKRNIVRPGVTRFASSFLTLQSILEKEEKLKFMFLSKEWGESKWSTKAKGIKAYQTIVSQAFWMNIAMLVDLFKPLVKVLRLVDGDWRPSMAFVYGELKEAKNEIIKVCKNSKETYEPILDIIDSKIKGRLDSPLHLSAYLLNPYYYYKDKEFVGRDANCMSAVLTCIEAFFLDDYDLQDMVGNVELLRYKNMEGMFGKKLAIMGRMRNEDQFDIVGWWSNYGAETPNLQKMALKIVSLTSSSSGCERNWSCYEGIHTKKRNRLDVERLHNLVYVKFNAKLTNKKNKMKDKHDVLLASDASMTQEWIVEGCDDDEEDPITGVDGNNEGEFVGLPRVGSKRVVRELDEDNFEPEDEMDEDIIFDESDQEIC